MRKFKIADLVIEMDCHDSLISDDFFRFECSPELETNIYWRITSKCMPISLSKKKWVRYNGFKVCKSGHKVIARYLKLNYYLIKSIVYEDNYRKATVYLPKMKENDIEYSADLKTSLKIYQKEMFFLALLSYKGVSIHSASIIYRNFGLVYSAKSGTGKSTHTNLWKKYYDTPILDGDVTVCRVIGGKPYIYGLPWCGSSNLYLNQRAELKAVFFLSQGAVNAVRHLNVIEAYKLWIPRSFTSRWFSDIIQEESKIVQEILSTGIHEFSLTCDISKEAVDMGKAAVDQLISG